MAKTEPTLLSTLFEALAEGGQAYAKNSPKLNPALMLTLQDQEMKKAEFAQASQLFTKKMAESDAQMRKLQWENYYLANPEKKGEIEIKLKQQEYQGQMDAAMSMIPKAQAQGFNLDQFSAGGMDFGRKGASRTSRGNISDRQYFMGVAEDADASPYAKKIAMRFLENADKFDQQAANQQGNYNEELLKQYGNTEKILTESRVNLAEMLSMLMKDPEDNAKMIASTEKRIADIDAQMQELQGKKSGITAGGVDPELAKMLKDPEIVKLLKELKSAKK